jgi:hypothetical protein
VLLFVNTDSGAGNLAFSLLSYEEIYTFS